MTSHMTVIAQFTGLTLLAEFSVISWSGQLFETLRINRVPGLYFHHMQK